MLCFGSLKKIYFYNRMTRFILNTSYKYDEALKQMITRAFRSLIQVMGKEWKQLLIHGSICEQADGMNIVRVCVNKVVRICLHRSTAYCWGVRMQTHGMAHCSHTLFISGNSHTLSIESVIMSLNLSLYQYSYAHQSTDS